MPGLVLIIGNKAYSSWSLRPWLLMKQAGIAFEESRISLYAQGARQKILAQSPAGKLPILKDGSLTIWDSLAIAEYLAEKHPRKQLWPGDAHTRARARAISAEMHSGFTNLRASMPMNVRREILGRERSAEVLDEIARIEAIWSECRRDHAGGGPFLFGEFCIADAMYAPVVSRFRTYGVALAEPAATYAATVMALPAMQEWIAGARAETEVNPRYE
ncbi:MAG TPA: glutathione S-transferase family protein [Burkholderiales bacterium]|nr:glutathione S-transferase family protein [Burkholderiales bacterium]